LCGKADRLSWSTPEFIRYAGRSIDRITAAVARSAPIADYALLASFFSPG
jgi:hypothetical protein